MVSRLNSVASHPTRRRRSARLSVARLQSADPGSNPETRRSALGARLSVDTYSQTTTTAVSQSVIQSVNVLGSDASLRQNAKCPNRLTLAYSALLFAARPKAVSVGSDAWALRPLQRTRRVSPRCHTITTADGLGVCSICTHK